MLCPQEISLPLKMACPMNSIETTIANNTNTDISKVMNGLNPRDGEFQKEFKASVPGKLFGDEI
jgi:hypothetical protein